MRWQGWIWGLFALAAAGPALAELEICNDTDLTQSIAIGHMVEGEWTSEGWWNIDPGDCAVTVSGDLANRYYYYHADAPEASFDGEGVFFCTLDDVFTIPGQDDCAARGYERADFRQIDTGATATSFTLTLVAPEDLEKQEPEDQGEPFDPPKRTNVGPEELKSGFVQGSSGEPFYQMAQFQGCDAFDGARYCAFHADGFKWYAYYGGPMSDAFLDKLSRLPMGVNVELEGDILNYGDISVEMALSQVTLRPNGFPYQAQFDAVQGIWVSADDPLYRIEFVGSELFESYDGGNEEFFFWRFADTCDEAPPGAGPALIKTTPETQESQCFLPDVVTETRLEMFYAGRGNLLSFRRP